MRFKGEIKYRNELNIRDYFEFKLRDGKGLRKRMKNGVRGRIRMWVSVRHIIYWLIKAQTDNLYFARAILWMIYQNCNITIILANYSCNKIPDLVMAGILEAIPDLRLKDD